MKSPKDLAACQDQHFKSLLFTHFLQCIVILDDGKVYRSDIKHGGLIKRIGGLYLKGLHAYIASPAHTVQPPSDSLKYVEHKLT